MNTNIKYLKDYLTQHIEVNGIHCWADLKVKEQKECAKLAIECNLVDDAELWLDEIQIQKLLKLHYLGIFDEGTLGSEIIERYEEICEDDINQLISALYETIYDQIPPPANISWLLNYKTQRDFPLDSDRRALANEINASNRSQTIF